MQFLGVSCVTETFLKYPFYITILHIFKNPKVDVPQEKGEEVKAKCSKGQTAQHSDDEMGDSGAHSDTSDSEIEDEDMSEKNVPEKKSETPGKKDKKKFYVLFLGNLPYSATVDDINNHFQQIGTNLLNVHYIRYGIF